MFALRNVVLNDLEDLYELSRLYRFISLPSDKNLIEKKIKKSIRSFTKPSKKLYENDYIFVIEDLEQQKVVGCSMIHAQHGYPDEPHFFLKVSQENKFSQTINTGFIHGTLKLGYDTDGPTEIGGLILSPDYRGHQNKLGKQLSFVRFLYIALHPEKFKDVLHSELMPPFDSEGRSPLWEAIGRRFLNMEYLEADILSRHNKEFILSLFPSGTIYETLLPIEARNAIGKVGKDTEPVKKMLSEIGFRYTHEVDPFDGGPHYRARTDEIRPIREKFNATIKLGHTPLEKTQSFLVVLERSDFQFYCIHLVGQKSGNDILVEKKTLESDIIKEGGNYPAIPL